MNQSFQLVQGGSQNQNLPFWARSVSIDNPGGQYVNVPQVPLTVPPYTGGVVATLPVGTTSVRFDTTPPQGLHANGGGSPATLTFDSAALPVSAGTPYTALQAANSLIKQYFVAAGGGTADTLTFWASTIKVDNPGGQWIRVATPNGLQFVAPYTMGRVISLLQQTQTVAITTVPPPGQVNTGTGGVAVVTYTDQLIIDTPGAPYGQNLSQGATLASIITRMTGPNPNAAVFTFQDTVVWAAGTWRIAALYMGGYEIGPVNPRGVDLELDWVSGGTTPLWAAQGWLGSGVGVGAGFAAGGAGETIIFAPDARPQFVSPGGGHLQLVLQTLDGNNFGLNAVAALFTVGVVPATL